MVGKTQIWRRIAIVAFFILLTSTLRHLFYQDYFRPIGDKEVFSNLFAFILNCTGCLIFLYLCFNPLKFELYGFVSFLYSSELIIDVPTCQMSVCMYILCIVTLYVRGLLKTHTERKITGIILIYIALLCTEIRFGLPIFINSAVTKTGYLLVIAIIILFLFEKVRNLKELSEPQILNLTKYPNLTERDKEWIKIVLSDLKYTYIALNYNLKEGTVRNQMRKIYKELNVPDRIGFLSQFSGCKVISTEEELLAWKSRP
ncbi:MAG: hypothetical protein BKP49_04300 [Treponema sp. CETP13]|nr:MAG: hypothetical protein BKP49_04300 [Treponema sp. CETP13]